MLSQEDENGVVKWTTGLTARGITASLITAGTINVQDIQIYAGGEPSFRWDSFGITAYDFAVGNGLVSGMNTKKFVRFDRFGFYGADFTTAGVTTEGIAITDGAGWHPDNAQEILNNATFALTWEGLKVSSTINESENAVAWLGKHTIDGNDYLFSIVKNDSLGEGSTTHLLSVDTSGNATFAGDISAARGEFKGNVIVKNDAGEIVFAAYGENGGSNVSTFARTRAIFQETPGSVKIAGFSVSAYEMHTLEHDSLASESNGIYLGNDGISVGKNFSVTAAGVMNASEVNLTGTIYATGGEIAKWEVTEGRISKLIEKTSGDGVTWETNKNYRIFGMQIPTGQYKSSVNAIAIGQIKESSNWNDAAFRVTHDGKLYATGASINGEITATSGKIGDW
jgi:hypothetical protein